MSDDSPEQEVIADAGPIIALGKLHRLDLLAKLFGVVRLPEQVHREAVLRGKARGHQDARVIDLFWSLHEWPVTAVPPALMESVAPEISLGEGERAAIALGKEKAASLLLLLDDGLARREARRLGFRIKGTLGILVAAYREKWLGMDELEILVREIEDRPDLWISSQLCQGVLAAVKAGRAAP